MDKGITRRTFLKHSAIMAALPFLNIDNLQSLKKGPPDRVGTDMVSTVTSVCEMCFWRCLIVGKVKDGRLVKIEGNPKSPSNGEKVCARGNAGIHILYDPDRLKYPMKRVGKRGEGKWKRISWNEALDTVAEKLKNIKNKYGPQSLALFPHGHSASYIKKLFEVMGSESICEPSMYQCRGNRDMAYLLTFGDTPGSPERVDLANTKLMVFFGTHLGENIHVSQLKEWIEGLSKGAKLIVIDPRFSIAASKADMWLPIRPGTDTALILTWINYLINIQGYDKEFVSKCCNGFEELKEAVKHATVEWAERITDIKAEQIKKAADWMAKYKPHVVIHPGRHSTWYGIGDTQRARAMAILTAILGAYGRKGSIFLSTPIKIGKYPCNIEKEDNEEEELLRDKWPFNLPGTPTADIIDATITGSPYPIKAWVVWGQNTLQNTPNQNRTIKAMEKLEFLVVTDILPSPMTLYADIILPEQTYLERYDVILVNKHNKTPYISIRQPIVKPLYEAKDPYWITKNIAIRMGYKDCFPYKDVVEVINKRLSPLNLSIKKINQDGGVIIFKGKPYYEDAEIPEFYTESGKVELYSKEMEDMGVDPIPVFEPPQPPPKGFVRLIYGRSPVHSFTRTQNNIWLHNEMPENELWINDKLAQKIGIKDGEYILLENQDGVRSNKPIKVKVTPGIRPDCVYMQALFGSPSYLLRCAYNSGVSDTKLFTKIVKDPVVGTMGLRVNFVRFIKNSKVIELPELIPLPPELRKTSGGKNG